MSKNIDTSIWEQRIIAGPGTPGSAFFKIRDNIAVRAISCITVPANLAGLTAENSNVPQEFRGLNFWLFENALLCAGVSSSPEALKKLDILDLGCGSDNFITVAGNEFGPELCRALHAAGAHRVVGVDRLHPNKSGSSEEWEFQQMDLTQIGVLNKFAQNSFDIVNTTGLLAFAHQAMLSPGLPWSHFSAQENTKSQSYRRFEQEIIDQALRILRTGGLLIINHEIYKKNLRKDLSFGFEGVRAENELTNRFVDLDALVFAEY